MSKLKKISAIIMAFALVVCAGYFSSLSPTTAWFYQSQVVNDNNNTFIFADFNTNGKFTAKEGLKIDGVTSFKDESETMFDSVVKVVDVLVENKGGMPARIYSTVNTKDENAKGFRYFTFAEDKMIDGSVIKTIRAGLGGDMTEESLKLYNVGEDGNGGHYEILNPGEQKNFKVAIWLEYDDVDYETAFESNAWQKIPYEFEIIMNATQDEDGALTR